MTEMIPLEVDEVDEFADGKNPTKMKVECICPMCGKNHTMSINWIGRGIPRKYCQSCKGSS
jgi:hypothetical protein